MPDDAPPMTLHEVRMRLYLMQCDLQRALATTTLPRTDLVEATIHNLRLIVLAMPVEGAKVSV